MVLHCTHRSRSSRTFIHWWRWVVFIFQLSSIMLPKTNGVQIASQDPVFSFNSFVYILGSGMAGSQGNSVLICRWISTTVFYSSCTIHTDTQTHTHRHTHTHTSHACYGYHIIFDRTLQSLIHFDFYTQFKVRTFKSWI